MEFSKVIGLEIDTHCIRAVKSQQVFSPEPRVSFEKFEEIKGEFLAVNQIKKGIAVLFERLEANPDDTVVTCVAGKESHVVMHPLLQIPENLEAYARQHLTALFPFNLDKAKLDCQVIKQKEWSHPMLLVAAISSERIDSVLQPFHDLGIPVRVVDLLPLAIANAHFVSSGFQQTDPVLILHIGSMSCTLVIEGKYPLFYRSFPFPIQTQAEELSKKNRWVISIPLICEELLRTMAYYERQHPTASIDQCFLLGNCQQSKKIISAIVEKVGLETKVLNVSHKIGSELEMPEGKFELAASLSLRDRRIHHREKQLVL